MSSIVKEIALVTGANSGIGFEIAHQLLLRGKYHVLLGSRSTTKGSAALEDLQARKLSGPWYVKEDSPPLHITHAYPALNMLTKEVHPEKSKTVVEYSSGSTVISLALVSRINHGIQDVRAFLSNKTSAPKLRLMQFFGLDMYVSLLLTMNNF